MIKFNELILRNFKSFGDYDTMFNLDNIGPVLISGEISESSEDSNGAGKSALIEAVIWCLFGRLSDNHNPGDKVVNWHTGKNCIVKLKINDEYEVIRTRKYDGHSDLLINHNGKPYGNDATNKHAQNVLNSLFNLDFNTFISSTFFGQSSGSFLSLGESKKKEVIEYMFGLTKLGHYASVAKDRYSSLEDQTLSIRRDITRLENDSKNEDDKLVKLGIKKLAHENKRKEEIDKLSKLIKESNDKINNSKLVDINDLKTSWNVIEDIKSKVKEINNKIEEYKNKKPTLVSINSNLSIDNKNLSGDLEISLSEIKGVQSKITIIEDKRGKNCPVCDSIYSSNSIDEEIELLTEFLSDKNVEHTETANNIRDNMDSNDQKIKKVNIAIDLIDSKITINKNGIEKLNSIIKKREGLLSTVKEAETENTNINNIKSTIKSYEKMRKNKIDEENVYELQISDSEKEIKSIKSKLKSFNDEILKLENKISHLKFIYKAYSEKKNLRSFIISGYISILNSRLSYYFNELKIESNMFFNEMLQMKSDKWDYVMHSGGEKKRVDLALMFALYDTYVATKGQVTNLLVLDEIDKELDKSGVNNYVELIINDLSNRVGSILCISHKEDIGYAFPSQVKIKKDDGFSRLEYDGP